MARKSIQERFWSKVEKTDDCWNWKGCINGSGYGEFAIKRRMKKAHRIAWILTHGPIPRGDGYHGVCVCHRCDNPICVRPDHLFLGTHLDNMRDKVAKNRQGDGGGPTSGRCKLTVEQVRQIRADTRSQVVIAAEYGMGQSQISRIKRGEHWRGY